MSYDASNAVPCNEWANCEDIIQESDMEMSNSSLTCKHMNRLVSTDSEASKHSFLSLNSSSILEINNNSQVSSKTTRPSFMRNDSRISNYSYAANSIIEEEDTEDAISNPLLEITTQTNEETDRTCSEDECENFSTVDDGTKDVNNELLCEIISYNEVC